MCEKIYRNLSKFSYIISALIVFALFSVLFALNDIYPFGKLTISWCDMDQQTIPLLCELKDVLTGKQSFFLSLQNAGGMNFYGVYFFNLSSPFTYLILFFDKADMPLAVNLMVILKLVTAALTFSLYLKYEIKNCSPFVIIAFAVTYAFSGYAMMYYQILSWLDVLYIFPLILIGLKRIKDGNNIILYTISLFACVLCHFYISWAVIIFICLYVGVHCYFNRENAKDYAFKFIIGSIIAALLSCVVLIPCFLQYTHSMRGSSILSSLKNSQFYPSIYTSLPTFFCLALSLPFVFYGMRKGNFISEKTVIFALMLVPVFVEPVSKAFQTYNYMSFPTRYGFITIECGLTLAASNLSEVLNADKNVDEGSATNKKKIISIAVSCVCVCLSVLFAFFGRKFFNENKLDLTAYSRTLWGDETSFIQLIKFYIVLLVFGGIIYLLLNFKLIREIAVYAVIGILCIVEAVFSCSVYMIAPSNDYADYKSAFTIENTIDDSEFYRVKTHLKYFDVNLIGALGYNGTSHYTSLNRESYMIAAKSFGYSSYWMEVNSNGGTSFTDAFLRNKYEIKSNSTYNSQPIIPSNAVIFSDEYSVLPNGSILPFGFLIDGGDLPNTSLNNPRWKIQNDFANRLLGVDLYQEIEPTSLNDVTAKETDKNYGYSIDGTNPYLYYKFKIEGKKSVYFDCFDRYSNSLRESTYNTVSSVKVYNLTSRSFSFGTYPTQQRNGVLDLGTYEDTEIRVYVYLNKDVNYNSFGVFTVDEDLLESAVNQTIAGDFTISNGKISGSVVSKGANEYALFCMPYDEGYGARVNGEKVEVVNFGGFIAIALNGGKNSVEINFVPEGFVLGIVAFVLGAIAFALYLIFGKKLEDVKVVKTLCISAVIALFALVVFAVYVGPIAINLLA